MDPDSGQFAARGLAVQGVQFHPEAMRTEHGQAMLRNFIEGK